jgi:hypothetical protein
VHCGFDSEVNLAHGVVSASEGLASEGRAELTRTAVWEPRTPEMKSIMGVNATRGECVFMLG